VSTGSGRLAGRTAIVTGASRGLGRAIATAFAREGAAVAVVARSEAQWDARLPGTIHEVAQEIEKNGGRAVAVPADLSRPEDVERLVEATRAALGPVDLLVNNAALTVPGRPPADRAAPRPGSGDRLPTSTGPANAARPPVGVSPAGAAPAAGDPAQTLHRSSFLNFPLKGQRMHFVLPDMLAAGRGAVVNISSVAGFIPGEGPYERTGVPGPIAYGGNKAALHHLTQSVAMEVQAYGIAVNVLSPSEPVITPGNLVAAAGETDWASPEDFAEATIRVALADPTVTNGQLLWSDDVLHPELGHRGWLRPMV
jgi:NAD(P)-dependent dehydrogenase (short-subunit alcohol dehydrogenase family)